MTPNAADPDVPARSATLMPVADEGMSEDEARALAAEVRRATGDDVEVRLIGTGGPFYPRQIR